MASSFFVALALSAAIVSVNSSPLVEYLLANQPATNGTQQSLAITNNGTLVVGNRVPGDYVARLLVIEQSTLFWGKASQVSNISKQIVLESNEIITRIEVTEQTTSDTGITITTGGIGKNYVTFSFRNPCSHIHVLIALYVRSK